MTPLYVIPRFFTPGFVCLGLYLTNKTPYSTTFYIIIFLTLLSSLQLLTCHHYFSCWYLSLSITPIICSPTFSFSFFTNFSVLPCNYRYLHLSHIFHENPYYKILYTHFIYLLTALSSF